MPAVRRRCDWPYTLGSRTDKDTVPGVREYALAVGDASDGERLQQRLRELAEAGYRAAVVVVGGGLTGIETATEIAERYPSLPVRLVTAGRLGYGLSEGGRAYIRRTFDRLGIAVQEQTRVERVTDGTVVTASGEVLPCGLCIWAGSFQALPLTSEAGAGGTGVRAGRNQRSHRADHTPGRHGRGHLYGRRGRRQDHGSVGDAQPGQAQPAVSQT